MKRFALSLSLPALGALAFAMACSDATSPDPHAALRPGTPNPAVQGNLPPPPTRTAIDVSVSTTGTTALLTTLASPTCTFAAGAFEGVYFANGRNIESVNAATQLADQELAFEGTAWLRIDNAQPSELETSASANARFQRTDQKFSGRGSLTFANGCVVVINEVTSFIANPSCVTAGEPCAQITFNGTINGQPAEGSVTAFDREFCTVETDEGGNPVFFCPEPGS